MALEEKHKGEEKQLKKLKGKTKQKTKKKIKINNTPSPMRAGTDGADMREPARGQRGNTTTSVPGLTHNMRGTGPRGLGRIYRRAIRNSSRGASSMKI